MAYQSLNPLPYHDESSALVSASPNKIINPYDGKTLITMRPMAAIPQTAVIGRQKPINSKLFTLVRILVP